MKYTLLAIIVACVVIFIASGCSVYYPTSYRAFIPKQWDSEYKEYQRLCSQKGIIYSRPIPQYIQDYYTAMQKAQKTRLHDTFLGFKISVNISWKPFWQSAW